MPKRTLTNMTIQNVRILGVRPSGKTKRQVNSWTASGHPCFRVVASILNITRYHSAGQTSLHLSLAGAIFLATKVLSRQTVATHVCLFCRNKIMFATSILLSRQTRVCCDKTRLLSRQKYACLDKTLVATNMCYLSRQKFCRDKRHSLQYRYVSWLGACIPGLCLILQRQNFCHEKHTFVSTKDVFCRDKHAFVATKFIATKMILVAAPASDKIHR